MNKSIKINKSLKGEKEISIRFKKNGKVVVDIFESTGKLEWSDETKEYLEIMDYKRSINSKLLEEFVKGY